jgi:hypothetical protein
MPSVPRRTSMIFLPAGAPSAPIDLRDTDSELEP